MAHKQKYTRGVVGHMLRHYNREKDVPEIDKSRSHLNYNLATHDQPREQLDFLHQRLSEIRVHNRKDVNVMVDWIVTAPKDLPAGDNERFFKETYGFLNDRYGKENVISAYVHMDETTPHIHYAFVPVIEDEKRGGFKLSAKEVVTRGDLLSFHFDLDTRMQEVFGRDIGVLNEETRTGNKSVQELKQKTAAQEAQIAREQAEIEWDKVFAAEKEKEGLQGKIEGLEGELSELLQRVQNAREMADEEKLGLDDLRDEKKALQAEIVGLKGLSSKYWQPPKGEPSLTGKKVTFSKDDADALLDAARNYSVQRAALQQANGELGRANDKIKTLQRTALLRENEELKRDLFWHKSSHANEVHQLNSEIVKLKSDVESMDKLITKYKTSIILANRNFPGVGDEISKRLENPIDKPKQPLAPQHDFGMER